MNIKIRKAKLADKESLIQLYREFDAFLNTQIRTNQQQEEEQYSDYEASVDEDSNAAIMQNTTFVAITDKKVVGYISGSIKNREYKKYDKIGHIADLFITKSYQHSGIGKRLVDAISVEFKEADCNLIQLNCLKNNPIARAAYEHWGFRADSIRYQKVI